MRMIKGSQSIQFENAPYIICSGSIVGKKEADGPLGTLFDRMDETSLFGESTWEAAESKMQKETINKLKSKKYLIDKNIDLILGGDLINQEIVSTFTMKDFDIPFIALYLILLGDLNDGSKLWEKIIFNIARYTKVCKFNR